MNKIQKRFARLSVVDIPKLLRVISLTCEQRQKIRIYNRVNEVNIVHLKNVNCDNTNALQCYNLRYYVL